MAANFLQCCSSATPLNSGQSLCQKSQIHVCANTCVDRPLLVTFTELCVLAAQSKAEAIVLVVVVDVKDPPSTQHSNMDATARSLVLRVWASLTKVFETNFGVAYFSTSRSDLLLSFPLYKSQTTEGQCLVKN